MYHLANAVRHWNNIDNCHAENKGHQIYDVLPNSLFDRLGDDLKYWEYCNESYKGDFMNWGRTPDWGELIFLEAAIHIKLKIQKIIRENVRCCKLHFNGQTVGQHSSFHKDYQEDIFWTLYTFYSISLEY